MLLQWTKDLAGSALDQIGHLLLASSEWRRTETARRRRHSPAPNYRWFIADEVALVEALSCLIMPSDEGSPGAPDMQVFGASAAALIDESVADSEIKQRFYRKGLISFDE